VPRGRRVGRRLRIELGNNNVLQVLSYVSPAIHSSVWTVNPGMHEIGLVSLQNLHILSSFLLRLPWMVLSVVQGGIVSYIGL